MLDVTVTLLAEIWPRIIGPSYELTMVKPNSRLLCMLQNLRGTEVKGSTAALSDKSLKRATDQEEHTDDDDDVWNKMDVVTSSVKRKRLQKSKN